METFNSDNDPNLNRECNKIVSELNGQLELYKREHNKLKAEILDLSEENQKLLEKLEKCITEQAAHNFNYSDRCLVENLKSQLELAAKERDSANELWKTSLQRIDQLENEIKWQSLDVNYSSTEYLTKIKKMYENKVKYLQAQYSKSRLKFENTLKLSEDKIKLSNAEMEKMVGHQARTAEQIKALENQINTSNEKCIELELLKKDIMNQLNDKDKIIGKLHLDLHSSKLRVAEACHVAEAALLEKDAAINREQKSQFEIQLLTEKLAEIMCEAENKLKRETEKAKSEYDAKVQKYKLELKKVNDEVDLKNLELEKQESIMKQLENDIHKLKKSNSNLENNAEKEKEVMGEKLAESSKRIIRLERDNLNLSMEIEAMKYTLSQAFLVHEANLNGKELEKKAIESKVLNLESDLQICNKKMGMFANRTEELKEKIRQMEYMTEQKYELKSAESERMLSERILEIKQSNNEINADLRDQLKAQISLNIKWRNELRLTTKRMEDRIKSLRSEICDIKRDKRHLENQLAVSENNCVQYKEHLKVLCKEFQEIAKSPQI